MDEVNRYGNIDVGHREGRCIQAPLQQGKDVTVLTAMIFELDKKTTEAVSNMARLDIMAIALKNAGKAAGGKGY